MQNLQMLRAVRLVKAQQGGLSGADFIAALDDAYLSSAFTELLSRRGQSAARSVIATTVGGMSVAEATEHILTQSAFAPYILASSAVMTAIAADSASVASVAASTTAMSAIAASTTAMSAIAASTTAMSVIAASSGAMTIIAASSATMVAVLSNGVSFAAIKAVPTALSKVMGSTALATASVPTMTSNTAPKGVASASSVYDGYPAYLAFDKNNSTFWAGAASSPTNQWIQYTFPSDAFVSSVSVLPYEPPYNPINCRIECSNDGINFSIIKTFVMENSILNTVGIAKAGFYRHWRLFVENIGGPSHPGIHELNFTGFVKP